MRTHATAIIIGFVSTFSFLAPAFALAQTIPLTWNDPMFNTNVSSNPVTVPNGGSTSYKSITSGGGNGELVASVVFGNGGTMDHVRINSQEGVRVGGDGVFNITNSYIETTGVGDDHADGIQAYSPGSHGTINISNAAIVSHNSAATAGLFVADNWTGTINLTNVVVQGGPYGVRIYPDTGGDNHLNFSNVYFVGPFGYGDFIVDSDVGGHTNYIDTWNNVREATIVNGTLVPGALIPCPGSHCPSGSGTTDTTAPSAPSGLSATAVSSSQINLSWTASTDNVGVTGYQIYRGGTLLTTVTGTSYSNTGLTASTAYSYYVRAVDAAGNVSGNSNTASATTQAGTIPPPPASTKFSNGDTVITTQSVAVRATPNGTKLGSQPNNSLGTVVGGPTVAGSYTWWQIDYGSGVDGWSAEPYLLKYTPPFSIGSRVATTDAGIGVRSAPAGTKIGTQKLGALGTVLGGPTSANGNVWWNIDYDVAPDGWSAEKYLALSTTPPPPPPATTPAPTVTLTASPVSITSGQSSTLAWSSTNATSCAGSGFTVSGIAGSVTVSPTATSNYSITCTGTGGTASASATVTVASSGTTGGTSSASGYPDASTTGVRPGVTLSAPEGAYKVTTNGAVISGRHFTDTLRIEAQNVVVRDNKFDGSGYNNIIIPDGYSATVEYNDISGQVNGISGTGIFRYNDISHVENGVNLYGPSTIEGNYIHDLTGSADAHFDGIEINGGGGHIIRNNTVINQNGQTSALMINNDFGAVKDMLIENNRLVGGGYAIYTDARFNSTPVDNLRFLNNRIGKGQYGYTAYLETATNIVWSGNVDDTTGAAIPCPATCGTTSQQADTTAPSAPANLSASAISSSQINLTWTASTDNVAVTGYRVFRGGTQVGTPTGTSYSDTGLTASTAYSYTVKAVDAAGNVSANSNTASATTQAATSNPAPTPTPTPTPTPAPIPAGSYSILTTQVPGGVYSDGATSNYELGTKFKSSQAGQISAIRFYKASNETGTHTGRIWDSNGTQLATVTFSGETASGWQTQNLATPLTIAANTTYMVTVNTGGTYYSATNNGLTSAVTNGPLSTVVGDNGVFGPVGAYPTQTWQASNYFRDVVFTPSATPAPAPAAQPATQTLKLGHDSVGSKVDSSNSGFINVTKFTTGAQGGTATSMSVYVASPVDTGAANQYAMGIYADAGGKPGSLIANTAAGTLTANAWNTLPISATLAPNTTYWLGYNTNGTGNDKNNMKYDTGSSKQTAWRAASLGTWPASFGAAAGTSDTQFSIYVTYTAPVAYSGSAQLAGAAAGIDALIAQLQARLLLLQAQLMSL